MVLKRLLDTAPTPSAVWLRPATRSQAACTFQRQLMKRRDFQEDCLTTTTLPCL